MPKLFSYGTLQKEAVQLDTFGRKLSGAPDTLIGYALNWVEITDPEVLRMSNQKHHPIIDYSGDDADRVDGVLFDLTDAEIAQADDYEVDDYKRIEVTFQSGNKGYIYVKK